MLVNKFHKQHTAIIFLIAVLIFSILSCSESEQATVKTVVAQAGQTAMAEGEKYAKTQVAQLAATAEAMAATEAAKLITTLIPDTFSNTIKPPYDACVGKSVNISSPQPGSEEIIDKGFAVAKYSCDKQQGIIDNSVLLFGGKNGSIIEPPNYEADVSSGIEFDFIPSFTGNLRIDVTLSVNSKTGAAAGSSLALVDIKSILLEFLLPTEISGFIDISKALIFETGAGVKTYEYVYVDSNNYHDETTTIVGGRGFAASFPIPPNSQDENYVSEQVPLSFTTPVTSGTKYYIGAGIRTTARVNGWAISYWNPRNDQDTFITSIVLTEVK